MEKSTSRVIETTAPSANSYDASELNSLPNAFRLWAERTMLNINVCAPAIVEHYDRDTHTAIVTPLVQRMDAVTGENFSAAPRKVSVWRLQTGGFLVDAPVFAGDTGWLMAADRDSTMAKAGNSHIQDSDTYQGNSALRNSGPQPIPNGNRDLHNFSSGFFIPDRWGEINVGKDFGNDEFVIERINPLGLVTSAIALGQDGAVNVYVVPKSRIEGSGSIGERANTIVSIRDGSVKVSRASGTDSESVELSGEGLIYEGTPDFERQVLSDIRYDVQSHQIQVKKFVEKVRGDFVVEVGELSDWTMIEGGQAVPEQGSN